MDVYLVGGAVRDQLLGLPVAERDWVVVGAEPATLLAQGYRQVGKDFPVYLNPHTKEEYALARTERKTGPLHTDFECNADPSVTLEQDLFRRDLTINAIAQDKNGELIDPYGGQEDLRNKVLRHVSPAFAEDPLRVLRIARFAARFPDFTIAENTKSLMCDMVNANQLQSLSPERIYLETEKALSTDNPHRYFEILIEVNAHDALWTEFDSKDLVRLKNCAADNNPLHAFIVLASSLAQDDVDRITSRWKFPGIYQALTALTIRIRNQQVDDLGAEEIVSNLYEMDAFRRRERFEEACRLARMVEEAEGKTLAPQDPWLTYIAEAAEITAASVDHQLSGAAIGQAIRSAQIERIEQLK